MPSAMEPSVQVEEEAASPSFSEPDTTAPAESEPGSQVDGGLQWFATPVARECRLEKDPARYTYSGRRRVILRAILCFPGRSGLNLLMEKETTMALPSMFLHRLKLHLC